MRKIKILRIIARLNIGGPAIHTVLLTQGLDKSKFDSLLVCGSVEENEGDMLYYALERNVKPIFVSKLRRELNFIDDIAVFFKIYKIIKQTQPDILHTHTAKSGAIGRLAGIIFNLLHPKKKIKLVHTFHGTYFAGYFNRLKTKVFLYIEHFLAIFTDRIITLSNNLKQELIFWNIAKAEKITVIPLGFELENFLEIKPADNNSVSNIGIIGRLTFIKNHYLFLDAAQKFIKYSPNRETMFYIIGDGELREALEGYADKLHINSRVCFLGWQNNLQHIYSRLDVVALTSLNEGTPVSLIEAMASGRPVVATDVGGVKDLLGKEIEGLAASKEGFKVLERGIIVKPNDVDSFARALAFILENREIRNKICASSREFVKSTFFKKRLVSDIEELYCSIIF